MLDDALTVVASLAACAPPEDEGDDATTKSGVTVDWYRNSTKRGKFTQVADQLAGTVSRDYSRLTVWSWVRGWRWACWRRGRSGRIPVWDGPGNRVNGGASRPSVTIGSALLMNASC